MVNNFQTDLTTLIGKCECAIRRGTTSYPDKLNALQEQLVAAQDASDRTSREEQLRTAIHFYVEHIPEDARQSNLAPLTEAFEQIDSLLETDDNEERPGAGMVAGD